MVKITFKMKGKLCMSFVTRKAVTGGKMMAKII